MTPSCFELIVNCELPSVVFIALGREKMRHHHMKMWRDKVKYFANVYGPTETNLWCTSTQLNDRPGYISESNIGFPLPYVKYYVLDSHRQPVPVGVVGELYIAGTGVGRGYISRPDLTRRAFVMDPYRSDNYYHIFRTGDLVKLLPDGSIFFIGQNDGQMKFKGGHVALGEVEMALRSVNPCITRAVVLEYKGGLVGFVTPMSVNGYAAKTAVSEELPLYMVPTVILSMDSIPTTFSGKTDWRALLNLLYQNKGAHNSGVPDSSPGLQVVTNYSQESGFSWKTISRSVSL